LIGGVVIVIATGGASSEMIRTPTVRWPSASNSFTAPFAARAAFQRCAAMVAVCQSRPGTRTWRRCSATAFARLPLGRASKRGLARIVVSRSRFLLAPLPLELRVAPHRHSHASRGSPRLSTPRVRVCTMNRMRLRRVAFRVGLAFGVLLFIASMAKMPAHPEGPPQELPWYLFYASFAVTVFTFVGVGIAGWTSGLKRRRDLGLRLSLFLAMMLALALGGLAIHVYVNAPYNRVECERNGLAPHHIACSYHNRNTPQAHDRALYLTGTSAAVVFLAAVVFRADDRKRYIDPGTGAARGLTT
jgi:hypothetical protein